MKRLKPLIPVLLATAGLLCILLWRTGPRTSSNGFRTELPALSDSPDFLAEYADGDRVAAAYRTGENGLVPLDRDQFALLLQAAENEPAKPLAQDDPPAAFAMQWFAQTDFQPECPRIDLQSRASYYLQNRGSASSSVVLEAGGFFSFTSSLPLTAWDIQILRAGMEGDFTSAAQCAASLSVDIPAQTQMWVEFFPIAERYTGLLSYCEATDTDSLHQLIGEREITLYLPRLVPGTDGLDGVYLLMQSPI